MRRCALKKKMVWVGLVIVSLLVGGFLNPDMQIVTAAVHSNLDNWSQNYPARYQSVNRSGGNQPG